MEITAVRQNASIRKRLTCFRDADTMVGEVVVHLRNINLHHMTGRASAGRNGTDRGAMADGFARSQ